jgi:hypothetical protein
MARCDFCVTVFPFEKLPLKPRVHMGCVYCDLCGKQCCVECGTTRTPQWRHRYNNITYKNAWCNACGIYFNREKLHPGKKRLRLPSKKEDPKLPMYDLYRKTLKEAADLLTPEIMAM